MKNANDPQFMGSTMDKIVLGGGFLVCIIAVVLEMCCII